MISADPSRGDRGTVDRFFTPKRDVVQVRIEGAELELAREEAESTAEQLNRSRAPRPAPG